MAFARAAARRFELKILGTFVTLCSCRACKDGARGAAYKTMQLAQQLSESFAPLVDLIYPPRCPLCGDALGRQNGLCTECWSQLELPSDPQCSLCARPVPENSDEAEHRVCAMCVAEPPRHCGVAAGTVYNDASRKMVLLFKHGRKIALAQMLARLMAARLDEPQSDEASPLLVPVPLHRFRIWKRGFNQAALLARELERLGKGELMVDALVRRKSTPSLAGLGSDERRRTLANAIALKRSRQEKLRGRDIVLVDDVLTSGATSNACVEPLLAAGARSVKVACFARVTYGQTDSV